MFNSLNKYSIENIYKAYHITDMRTFYLYTFLIAFLISFIVYASFTYIDFYVVCLRTKLYAEKLFCTPFDRKEE